MCEGQCKGKVSGGGGGTGVSLQVCGSSIDRAGVCGRVIYA